jgi:hypothetical protein
MKNNQRNWILAFRANEEFGHLRFKILSTKQVDKHTSDIDEELVDYVDIDEFNRIDVDRVPLFEASRYGILPNIDELPGFNTKTKIIAVIHKNIYSGCIYNLSLYYFPEGQMWKAPLLELEHILLIAKFENKTHDEPVLFKNISSFNFNGSDLIVTKNKV